MKLKRRVLLRYSREKADQPILANVIRKTDIALNILHADLTPKGGEIFVSLDGSKKKVNEAIKLLKESGIEVNEVVDAISLDREACVDCGACISLCPTEALILEDDYSLTLEEEKCVYCKACIPACPVKALKIREL